MVEHAVKDIDLGEDGVVGPYMHTRMYLVTHASYLVAAVCTLGVYK